MIKKHKRRCRHCGCLFEVCNKVKKHEYCKRKECQQARKRKWQEAHLEKDEAYKQDQKTAHKTGRTTILIIGKNTARITRNIQPVTGKNSTSGIRKKSHIRFDCKDGRDNVRK